MSGGLWNLEDLDLLASDLDSSLSGLGSATTDTFDMTDALSAIQVIKMDKDGEDFHSRAHCAPKSANENEVKTNSRTRWFSFSEHGEGILSKEQENSARDLSFWNFSPSPQQRSAKVVKKPCCTPLPKDSEVRPHQEEPDRMKAAPVLGHSLAHYSVQPGCTVRGLGTCPGDFQYVLAAPTASITKMGEDSLTYLNQGQPYEIRLKKLQGLCEMKGKLLKSILHVGFQERRLQFREKMEIVAWQHQRPTERILDIDPSLSYGIFDIIPDPKNINSCEFMWDATREASVFLKVNCISTEFTSKRRGGEKGVPFRILIETFSHWETPPKKLDAASCLVKVFKSKGADRKHKTDREKLEKLPQVEQSDLQPSYQCTLFTPCSVMVEDIPFPEFTDAKSPSSSISTGEVSTSTPSPISSPPQLLQAKEAPEEVLFPAPDEGRTAAPIVLEDENGGTCGVDIRTWLIRNNFSKYLPYFSLYSARDLLCLSREDLVEICGAADGIRFFNKLHIREPSPLRKLYVSRDKITYHAIYLHSLKCAEFRRELCKVLAVNPGSIGDMYVTGPNDILLIVTDKVLQNMKDESTFLCEVLKAEEKEVYTVLLKSLKALESS